MRAAILVSLFATGCATTAADLRERPVTETFQATREPKAVALCLAESIRNLGAPSVYDGDGEVVVAFKQQNATTLLFRISNATREVKVTKLSGLIPYQEKTRACL